MQRTIIDGPSKFDLVISLFHGDSQKTRTEVLFYLEKNPGLLVPTMIDSVKREDGSGEKWLFKGYVRAGDFHGKVRGYYDTQLRRGWIKKEELPEVW